MFQRNDAKVVCQALGEELLVFQTERHDCHHLAPEAAFLWSCLEQERSAAELAESFRQQYPQRSSVAEEFVTATLADFQGRGLLQAAPEVKSLSLSRRRLLVASGLALVSSTILPLPAAAASIPALVITNAAYLNDTVTVPNTQTNCGGGGANGVCFLDITVALNIQVAGGPSLNYGCNNANLTDPCAGTLKECQVTYTCNGGAPTTIRVCENNNIVINC